MGIGLSNQPARLHRLAESILGLLKSLKYRLWLRHREKRGMKDDAVAEWFEPNKKTAKKPGPRPHFFPLRVSQYFKKRRSEIDVFYM